MNTLVEQETTPQQEAKLLLDRFRAAMNRRANSEAHVLAIRYMKLVHPQVRTTPVL